MNALFARSRVFDGTSSTVFSQALSRVPVLLAVLFLTSEQQAASQEKPANPTTAALSPQKSAPSAGPVNASRSQAFAKRVQTALDKRTSVEFNGETLNEIAMWLTEETGLPFENDRLGFDSEGFVPRDCEVSIQARDITFRTFLQLLAIKTECRVDWTVERECVSLSPRPFADEKIVRAMFDVSALLKATREFHDAKKNLWEPMSAGFGTGGYMGGGGLGGGGGMGSGGGGMFAIGSEGNIQPGAVSIPPNSVLPQFGGGGSFGNMGGGGQPMPVSQHSPPLPADELTNLLQTHSPRPWEMLEGNGGTLYVSGHILIVNGHQRQVEKVRQLLKTLNSAIKVRPQKKPLPVVENPRDLQLMRDFLATPKSLEFVETSLTQVLALLADQYGFNLIVDTTALEDAGLELDDSETTLTLRNVSLESTLNSILTPHELTWEILENCLVITTQDAVEDQWWQTIVCDIQDLRNRGMDENTLMDALRTRDLEWEDVDGSGGAVSLAADGLLLVSHTSRALRNVEETLAEVRSFKGDGQIDGRTPTRRQLVTKFYDIPAGVPNAGMFLETVAKLVEPETWTDSTHRLPITENRVVIRHAVFVHEKIARFIAEANAGGDAQEEAAANRPTGK